MPPAIRDAVRGLDPRIRAPTIESVASIVDASTAERRFQTTLLTLFAASALVLTAIGIFGVVSYGVQRRVREIGVRVALGAQRRDVLRLIVGRSLAVVCVGAVVGLAGAFGLTRFLSSALFGVTATDPVTFALAVAVVRHRAPRGVPPGAACDAGRSRAGVTAGVTATCFSPIALSSRTR